MSFAPPNALESSTQDKVLGLLIVIALLSLGYIYWVSSSENNESNWIPFDATMTNTYGITQGTTISFNGIDIGVIHNIQLDSEGSIALQVRLDKQYKEFYVSDSKLVVDSTIGLGDVLSGKSLLFKQGNSKKELTANQEIQVIEPKELGELLDEWHVEELAQQLVGILSNLEQIVATIGNNQQNLDIVMNNLASSSSSLITTTEKLPHLLTEIDKTLVSVQNSIADSSEFVKNNTDDFHQLTLQSTQLLEGLDKLVESTQPIAESIPHTLDAFDIMLYETSALTRQLRGHWLLKSKSGEYEPNSSEFILFPIDESLYKDLETPHSDQNGKNIK